LELARADAGVIPLLLLRVEAAEAMHDHRTFDGEAERVLRGERECLAGVDHRGDGNTADGIGHGWWKWHLANANSQSCLKIWLCCTANAMDGARCIPDSHAYFPIEGELKEVPLPKA
jgi:hypothetical protein